MLMLITPTFSLNSTLVINPWLTCHSRDTNTVSDLQNAIVTGTYHFYVYYSGWYIYNQHSCCVCLI
jgi:hypothetical protein